MLTRVCKKCSRELPLEDFSKYKEIDKIIYRRYECAECYKERQLDWNTQNPTAKRRAYALRVWKMTLEEYEDLLSRGCEVCGTLEDLVVDHNHACCPDKRHTCGECIRGVLCNRHNLAEGCLRGNPDEAIALAEYMKRVNEQS